ncbi:MAG: ABC transporter permease [Anaerolineae bacterium]|nr:ABC transporter permease [Anaerolineae bacterium]
MSATTPIDLSESPAMQEARDAARSLWRDALQRFAHDRVSMLALLVLLIITLASFLGPPIVESVLHVDVNRTSVPNRYIPPNRTHLLGTDQLGRDQLIRLLYGGRISLGIAYLASVFSITIGVVTGIVAGYMGGAVDDLMVWFINTLRSIPAIFLLLIATTIWSPSPQVLIALLGFLGWFETSRLIRGQVIVQKRRDYVLAAQAVGASQRYVMFYHIFPNVVPIAIISLTISAGALILAESGLSFLGLGVHPPTPTWGNMLSAARDYFFRGAYLVVSPGVLITATVLCFYLIGDGLRDALDPRSRGQSKPALKNPKSR